MWSVGAPTGRLSKFNLGVAEARARRASFSFISPRTFAGITIFNDSLVNRALRIESPSNEAVVVTVAAGELQRVQTRWHVETSRIDFTAINGTTFDGWKFDDIRYSKGQTASP
jgi:hypothetical protein